MEGSRTAGVSIAALFIGLLGPMAGHYALIVVSSLAGALWALSGDKGMSEAEEDSHSFRHAMRGAFFLVRIVLMAVCLAGTLAWGLETWLGFEVHDSVAVVSFVIGMFGNGYEKVRDSAVKWASSLFLPKVKS